MVLLCHLCHFSCIYKQELESRLDEEEDANVSVSTAKRKLEVEVDKSRVRIEDMQQEMQTVSLLLLLLLLLFICVRFIARRREEIERVRFRPDGRRDRSVD